MVSIAYFNVKSYVTSDGINWSAYTPSSPSNQCDVLYWHPTSAKYYALRRGTGLQSSSDGITWTTDVGGITSFVGGFMEVSSGVNAGRLVWFEHDANTTIYSHYSDDNGATWTRVRSNITLPSGYTGIFTNFRYGLV
jgi:hypothetical protein